MLAVGTDLWIYTVTWGPAPVYIRVSAVGRDRQGLPDPVAGARLQHEQKDPVAVPWLSAGRIQDRRNQGEEATRRQVERHALRALPIKVNVEARRSCPVSNKTTLDKSLHHAR